MSKDHPTIAAIILQDKNLINGGKSSVFIAKDQEEQDKLAVEIGKAVRGDILKLTNGIYLIVNT